MLAHLGARRRRARQERHRIHRERLDPRILGHEQLADERERQADGLEGEAAQRAPDRVTELELRRRQAAVHGQRELQVALPVLQQRDEGVERQPDGPLGRLRARRRAHDLEAVGADVVDRVELVALDAVVRGERERALTRGPPEQRVEIGVRARRGVAAQREDDVRGGRGADGAELAADRQRRARPDRRAHRGACLVARRVADADQRQVHGRQLFGDQRHKMRAWLNYGIPVPPAIGRVDVGVIQRADSGVAVDVNGSIDPRAFVTNPGYVTPIQSVAYYFTPRGSFRWDSVWSTDVAITWGKKLPRLGSSELFFRGVTTNVFNSAAKVRGDIGINTRINNTQFQAFNPFTTTPVQGTHWDFSPTFGQPQAFDDYQPSRVFSFSTGLRF